MKTDGRVFERDIWLDGRTHVVHPAAASGRLDGQDLASWPDQASEEKLSERVVQPSQHFLLWLSIGGSDTYARQNLHSRFTPVGYITGA